MNTAQRLLLGIGKANGVSDPSTQFAVEPNKSQQMRSAVRISSDFLKKINIVTKENIAGEIVGLRTGLVASTTKTNAASDTRRHPKTSFSLEPREYRCRKTNFDHGLSYDDIDAWAAEGANKLGETVNDQITKSKALSLIAIALNGIKYASNSDADANPLLQDCGKGWLQKMREENAERVMGTEAKPIKYGPDQEYKNLDAVVSDSVATAIAEEFADRDDLVVICNRRNLGDKYFNLINASGEKATEHVASDIAASTRRLGGLPAMSVPYFPENKLFITPLSNLSIYFHKSGHRRKVSDEPEFDRLANYESENLDYIVEEYGAAVLIDFIEHVPAVAATE